MASAKERKNRPLSPVAARSAHDHSIHPDSHIAELAARQHGVFARAQALELGATAGMINRRLTSGRWDRLSPGVYRIAGAPRTWRQQLLAACLALGPGTVVSHRAAAALWALAGFDPGIIELIAPRHGERTVAGAIIHRPRRLDPADITTIDSIPVTTPARTLIDLASVVSIDRLEEALDDVLRRRSTSVARLARRLSVAGRQGRHGAAKLGCLIKERSGATSIPDSTFERRLMRLIARSGLPAPILQHRIKDGGRLVAKVDLGYPEQRVAVECDSFAWHGSRSRWHRDLARMNKLAALGWQVIHVTWSDMTERPRQTIDTIRRTITERSR